ncbi:MULTISPECIES: response regulator transcription factor [unclassified Polaribacter]|jgi:DNA-binding NarL/FixJ family response regulator|uniref:response regulator transcription factor n=1 Tax=unclassified Polaribacter TaxID=196858 RepID=UPI001C4EE0EC|nr:MULTISPECIES: response regulator transcription factor [unclassified Polaribacter]QXP65389.1 response regulator transcription factor [Polaribacter sp. HaHaR_3_91]QXP68744.1 response regulator transcription factor [Polaribacter sp. AHE13PA]
MNKINIIIADDEELFRKGIRFLLERENNFSITYEAENGKELIDFLSYTEHTPDIILMDLKMPEINGVEATKKIHKTHPNIKIIALTSFDGKSFITNMIDVGASSYLLKNTSPKMVIHTINEVFNKGFYYDEKVLKIIQENINSSSGKRIKIDLDKKLLSKREIDVLELICDQCTTAEIADKLFISPRTVEGHRNNLLLKTHSKNVAGLVIYGIQKKLIEVTPDFNI